MSGRNLTLEEFWKLPLEERCERYKDLSDHNKFGVRQAESAAVSVPCNDCKYYYGYAKCAAYPMVSVGSKWTLYRMTQLQTVGIGIVFRQSENETE